MHPEAGLPAHKLEATENTQSEQGVDNPGPRNCQERSELLAQYEATVEAYVESIKAMTDLNGMESRNAFQQLLEARSACETCHAALVHYDQQHTCDWNAVAS